MSQRQKDREIYSIAGQEQLRRGGIYYIVRVLSFVDTSV